MALDFPASPTNGQIFKGWQFNSAKGTWDIMTNSAAVGIHGIVDPGWLFGYPNVTLDSGAVVPVAGIGVSDLQPGDSATLTLINGIYYITGRQIKPPFLRQVPVALGPNWWLYSDLNNDAGEYGDAGATVNTSTPGLFYASMTSTGIVSLAGLLARTIGTGGTAGEVVAGPLPVSMRPARTQVVQSGSSSLQAWLYITPDGNIHLGATTGTWAAGNWLSIDTVRFRAASVGLALQTFTLVSGLADHTASLGTGDTTTSHTHGYTVDADGVVIFEGVVIASSIIAVGANITQITALNTTATDIYTASRSGNWCELRFGGTGGTGVAGGFLVSETALAVGNWLSLSNLIMAPNPVTFTWGLARLGKPTGSVYGSGYMSPGVARTPDGFVLLRGLSAVGTAGSEVMSMPAGYRPRYTGLYSTTGSGAYGAWNIGLTSGTWNIRGSIQFVVGTGTYASFAGMCWPAYS